MTPDCLWFLERLSAEMPTRLHSRDIDAGGSPEWASAFASWLSDDGQMTTVTTEQDLCNHPTLADKKAWCDVCEGSGLRVVHRSILKRPVKAALRRVGKVPVPEGRPKLHTVLMVLGANNGDFGFTARALSAEYAYMARPIQANYWIAVALAAFRSRYREDVPAREIRDRSQAQLDAEVAAA